MLAVATVAVRTESASALTTSWSGWNYLSAAGDKAQSITVARDGDGRLHAFMIGLDGQVWHNDQSATSYGASWSGWHYLSAAGDKAQSITVAPDGDGRLHAFMIGPDNQVWHNDSR
jgi:predicted ribonuclease YlaK